MDASVVPAQTNAQVSREPSDVGPQNCLWSGCGAQLKDPGALFMHINEDHVGRNSRGNLCLECRWDGCTVSKTKRDHLISHIKSHLSYKPYQCEHCSARFKHMSDLKRHEGTHRGKDNSVPTSTHNAIPINFPTSLATPELHAHSMNVELTQAPVNQLAGGAFPPANMDAIQPGGISVSTYAPGLPPSPMLTPSMQPYDGGRTAPVNINNYTVPGLFNASNAPNVTPAGAHLSGSPSDVAAMTEAMHGLGQVQDTAQEYLLPDAAQSVYLNFLSAVVAAYSQQTGPTPEVYQSLISLSQIDPMTLNALVETTSTEHLELLQQFHAQVAVCMVADGMIDPGTVQMSPPTSYAELPTHKPACPAPAQPGTAYRVVNRDFDPSKLNTRKPSEPASGRRRGLQSIPFISKLTAKLSRSKARSNRNSAPVITKYQPTSPPKVGVKSATLPKVQRNKGDKHLSIAVNPGKIFDSSDATLSVSPVGAETSGASDVKSLIDRLNQIVNHQMSTRQTASAAGETAEPKKKGSMSEPSLPLSASSGKQEGGKNEQKVDRNSAALEVSSDRQGDTIESKSS